MSTMSMKFELRDVPVQFANAIRRMLLNETPTVEIADVQILENTTLMPHEVMKHRVEMLPINCRPSEEDVIRNAKILLRVPATDDDIRLLTTNDFVVESTRTDILMKDADLGTPMFFLKLKKGETVHLTARLKVNPSSSQVCVATYMYHIDEEKAKIDSEKYEDKRLFENFHKQLSYHVGPNGRPDWFDFTVESIGVVSPKELVVGCLTMLHTRAEAWLKAAKEGLIRESEPGVFRVSTTTEGHTLGALLQIVIYEMNLCSFVSYDVPHPLRKDMNVRFRVLEGRTPEEVLDAAVAKISDLCRTTISTL
jgi:DNA-directed RNA polymerase subunit L